jgi:LPXTG-motif cell wall-anchored protein
VWNLGDIAVGETKTVTYKTKISNTQDDGLYKDLAWAKGTTGNEDTILAIDPSDSDNFVGTQVAVVTPTSEQVALNEKTKTDITTKHKTERVLGAAILAATGANGIWIILAGLLAVIGGSLMYFGRRKKIQANSSVKTIMKVFILTLLSLALLGFSGIARAATPDPNISVRIEDPKSPIDTGTFKIGFVTLDIQDRDLSAECYEETAGAITTEYVHKNGGNSGNCTIDSFADGSYKFYVIASIGGDSTESNHVTVEINTGAPGTPLNYSRANNSCSVTFTTANDGLTSSVELYRSTSLDFTADASTFAQEVAINPNLNGTITDPGPNCGDYYYAIRAMSAGGAGSAFVGDEKVTVKHKTKTQTTTEIINPITTGAIPVSGGAGAPAGGTVGGAETGQGVEQPQGGEGSVLGEEGVKNITSPEGLWESIKRNRWPELAIIALLAIIYYAYRRKRNRQPQIK